MSGETSTDRGAALGQHTDAGEAPFDAGSIGVVGDARQYHVTEEAMRAYAAATDDVLGGPVFAIVPVWETIAPASRSVASDEARTRVVHYEHDIVIHRPIEPGDTLTARATPIALLPRPNGTSLVIHVETLGEDGARVNEQYVTEFFRGIVAEESIGERAPDHRLDGDGTDPLAEVANRIAEDQPDRYAAASGDGFAIHLDDHFARAVGLPGRIVHGLCTMAFAARAVLEVAEADPRRVRRVAVRFSAPLFPGDTVTTRVWRTNGGFGFESLGGDGAPVLKDGLLELA
jgi:acyl dehydratase